MIVSIKARIFKKEGVFHLNQRCWNLEKGDTKQFLSSLSQIEPVAAFQARVGLYVGAYFGHSEFVEKLGRSLKKQINKSWRGSFMSQAQFVESFFKSLT